MCVCSSAVRKNQKGEGRVGSIDFMDSSGDIRGFFFNDDCDRWMSTLAVNTVYKVKGGQIKHANRQENDCKSDCEITFGRDTVFEPLSDADAPKDTYNFVKIELIEQMEPGRKIDVLAIVQVYSPDQKVKFLWIFFQESVTLKQAPFCCISPKALLLTPSSEPNLNLFLSLG